MNYEALFADVTDRTVAYALTGAQGGFSRSMLMQGRAIPALRLAALCDLDVDGTLQVMESLGYDTAGVRVCADGAQVRAAADAGLTVLVSDYRLLDEVPLDAVVEATGSPEAGLGVAEAALRRGVHVVMVSKETDSVAGPHLNAVAREHGAVYTTADGDQPSNLCGLVSWARMLGFDIVAAGKSSEYDYVFDPATGDVDYTGVRHPAPAMAGLLSLPDEGGVAELMRARSEALSGLPQSATPDYCEMNVVANSTGLVPARDELSYPLCRTTELADVFVPVEDGGILERTGVVDVFNCLRLPAEPSFGGGVFVVVRCADAEVWETLRAKGHVVGRNGRYAAIYLPYHLMGLETPVSVFSAVLHGRSSGAADQRAHAVMAARTVRGVRAGEALEMGGHHHDIEALRALLLPTAEVDDDVAPFYLAAGAKARVAIPAGTVLRLGMLESVSEPLAGAWAASRTVGATD